MAVIIFFISAWYLSLFCQTFFHHRYASHGAFTMSKGWEKFFYVLSWITQGSHYLSPRAYAIMHRMHHAFADTDKDPHSPSFSPNMVSMMLRTHRIYRDIYDGKFDVDDKFMKNLPDWPAFDKFASSTFSRLLWVAAYVAFFWAFTTSPWQWLLLPFVIGLSVLHGAIINWFAHKFGYTNFKMRNTSENLFKIDFLMLGESYHNNHHKHPSSVNFGVRWHEVDPVYPVILLLNKLGVIQIPKKKPVDTPVGATLEVKQEVHEEMEAW